MAGRRTIQVRHPILVSLGAGVFACALLAGTGLAQSQPANAPQDQTAAQQNSNTGSSAADSPATKKVYTNDDLRAMRSGDVSVVGNSKSGSKARQTSATGPKNEQYWRSRSQKLRNQMAEVDRQIAQIEAANEKAHNAVGSSNGTNPPPPSAYTVGAHARGASGYTTQLDRLKAHKAQIQAEIDQMEEEARRAEVPPGWLR